MVQSFRWFDVVCTYIIPQNEKPGTTFSVCQASFSLFGACNSLISDAFYDKKISNNCCLVIESADKAHLEFEDGQVQVVTKKQDQSKAAKR